MSLSVLPATRDRDAFGIPSRMKYGVSFAKRRIFRERVSSLSVIEQPEGENLQKGASWMSSLRDWQQL